MEKESVEYYLTDIKKALFEFAYIVSCAGDTIDETLMPRVLKVNNALVNAYDMITWLNQKAGNEETDE